MISDEFRTALSEASKSDVITAIISISSSDNGDSKMPSKADIINIVQNEGLRVNSLPGFPSLIVQASARKWAEMLEKHHSLLSQKNVLVQTNDVVAYAPPIQIEE